MWMVPIWLLLCLAPMHRVLQINGSKTVMLVILSSSCQKILVSFILLHINVLWFSHVLEILATAKERLCHSRYGLVQHYNGGGLKNKTCNHVFGKCIFNVYDESCMGIAICLLLGR